jgi:ferrous iron transport protein B
MSAVLELPSLDQANALEAAPAVRPFNIIIAGNPNAGKTSLFNSLTGLRQKVANYPGVTVESKSGQWAISANLPPARLVDLPGLYSLDATSLDEQIASDALRNQAQVSADAIVAVVDATNLGRNLYLALQLIETGQPIVIALTMFDLAQRNRLQIDIEQLSAGLGVPVVPVIARKRFGLEELGHAVTEAIQRQPTNRAPAPNRITESSITEHRSTLIKRYARIEQIVSDSVETINGSRRDLSERIDRVVTHRIFGPVILLLVMLLVFQAIFSWASLPMSLIDSAFSGLSDLVRGLLPAGILTDLLTDGVIAGVGGVVVFLPQILLLFLFISLLEDSGYMARAAFLMDRLMRAVGLHGKAFVPLLSSFACAVPGIMATRTIENPKDRVATIMIAPFMSCSARLPVYTLIIGAFFSGRNVFGVISLGAVIILAMYLLGIAVAIIVASILKRTILKAPPPPFVMELPPYRLPNFANVAHALLTRCTVFLKRAGTVILSISILLWALMAFPRSSAPATSGESASAIQIENSFAGRAGRVIEPAIKPLGFDWKIGIGLISSFAARETIISTLSIVYNVGDKGENKSASLVDTLRDAKRADGTRVWTPLTGISLMIFFLLACQCMSTVAIVRRETNSWRWPLFMIVYMMALAYVASLVTFQGGRWLGFV